MTRSPKKIKKHKDPAKVLLLLGALECLGGLAFLLSIYFFLKKIDRLTHLKLNTISMIWWVVGFMMAASLFWIGMGVGTILLKRWARVLILISSWLWLVFGVFFFGMSIYLLLMTDGQALTWFFSKRMLREFVFEICLPLSLIFFYSQENVKKTFLAGNPGKSWANSCPWSILIFVIFEVVGNLGYVISMPFIHFTILFFGVVFSGVAGAALITALTFIRGCIVWGLYRQKAEAWWAALVFFTIYFVGMILLTTPENILESERSSGFSNAVLGSIQKNPTGNWWMWLTLAICLCYLLWIKKYFPSLKGKKRVRGRSKAVR